MNLLQYAKTGCTVNRNNTVPHMFPQMLLARISPLDYSFRVIFYPPGRVGMTIVRNTLF